MPLESLILRVKLLFTMIRLKQYTTSLIKRQWGQNLIKFTGVKLPGGLELNGRQIYDDAVMELEKLDEKLMSEYAMPPLDFVG